MCPMALGSYSGVDRAKRKEKRLVLPCYLENTTTGYQVGLPNPCSSRNISACMCEGRGEKKKSCSESRPIMSMLFYIFQISLITMSKEMKFLFYPIENARLLFTDLLSIVLFCEES